MTTTVQRLGALIDNLQLAVSVCLKSRDKKEVLRSLSSVAEELNSTIQHLKTEERNRYTEARKALTYVLNMVNGMQDGLNEDMTPGELRRSAQLLQDKFFPRIQAGLEIELESSREDSEDAPLRKPPVPEGAVNRIKIVISKTSDMREAVQAVSQSTTISEVSDGHRVLPKLEALAQQARKALPVHISGAFQIVRVPIVPLFSHPSLSRAETLKRLGLKFVIIEGFTVLLDQILLLVSKKRAAKSNVTPLATAYSVVDLLNDRGGMKYEVVSDNPNPNPRNTDLLMYWILPRQRMSGLMKILGSTRTPATIKWGLPLPPSNVDVEYARIAKLQREEEEQEQKRQEELERLAKEREEKEKAKQEAKERNKEERAQAQRQAIEEKRKRLQAQMDRTENLQKRLQDLVRRNNARRGIVPNKAKTKK